MRALVIGHFSTVGDIESLEHVASALAVEEIAYDVLPYNPNFVAFIDGAKPLSAIDPSKYTHLVAVCGPFWPGLLTRRGLSLDRFAHCTRVGVNLTMILPVDEWNPFHVLLERDSTRMTRPDITFLRQTNQVPVAGLCTIARQREYGDRQRHADALGLFRQLIATHDLATIEIDTRWPRGRNAGGLRSPAQVLSLIGRVDVLLTNRLHGMVFGLKAGVPVLAIDPVLGGDKVTAQAEVLGWPACSTAEAATPEWMDRMLGWCLSPEARSMAQAVASGARTMLQPTDDELRDALRKKFDLVPLPQPPGKTRPGLGRRVGDLFRRRPAG